MGNRMIYTLLYFQGFFPGLIEVVFVLRPTGFLQRAFSDVGYKFVKDDFKFRVRNQWA